MLAESTLIQPACMCSESPRGNAHRTRSSLIQHACVCAVSVRVAMLAEQPHRLADHQILSWPCHTLEVPETPDLIPHNSRMEPYCPLPSMRSTHAPISSMRSSLHIPSHPSRGDSLHPVKSSLHPSTSMSTATSAQIDAHYHVHRTGHSARRANSKAATAQRLDTTPEAGTYRWHSDWFAATPDTASGPVQSTGSVLRSRTQSWGGQSVGAASAWGAFHHSMIHTTVRCCIIGPTWTKHLFLCPIWPLAVMR